MGLMQRIWPGLLALLSGAILALCYAPYNLAMMVWLGLVPLMVALWQGGRMRAGRMRRGKRRRLGIYGFGLGYLAGVAFWFINLKWIAEVGVVGLIAMALFLALYFAFWGAFAAGVGNPWLDGDEEQETTASSLDEKIKAKTKGKGGKGGGSLRESRRVLKFALVNAFWWCGLEWVRGWFLTGFGWNGLGVAFHDQPILAQSADLVGVTGLSFLPVFVMAVVVQVGRGLNREVKRGKMRAHWDFGTAMAFLTMCFLYGIWKLHGEKRGGVLPLNVLMVQLNIPQVASQRMWAPEEIHAAFEEDTLRALEELGERSAQRVKEAAESGSSDAVVLDVPDWVVWPESALSDYLFYTEEGEQGVGLTTHTSLEAVRPAGQFTMIFGLNELEAELADNLYTRKKGGKHFNSLLALPPGATKFETYRKQHLVLFGETIPYREQLVFLQKLWEMSAGTSYGGSFSAGEQEEPLRLPFARSESGVLAIIPTICFEDTVPRKMRKFVQAGGQVIVNITNDGWFKESEAAAQHFANAKFRSIEFRRPTIRCANTGVSAVVSAHGTVLDKEKNEQRVLVDGEGSHLTRGWLYATAYVPVDGPITLYARFGEWFAILGCAVGLGWWVAKGRRARPSQKTADSGADN